MAQLSHLDKEGRPRMVDVGAKGPTRREAVASGCVLMEEHTLEAVLEGQVPKGNVLLVAQLAGIQAAKKTWEFIPLCHPLALTSIQVSLEPDKSLPGIRIEARVQAVDRTGVEMEALTAVSVAALTVYDMCKAIDKGMVLTEIRLEFKSGGKSGTYRRS
jgi:cyclic pyranopterin phosphate synthase